MRILSIGACSVLIAKVTSVAGVKMLASSNWRRALRGSVLLCAVMIGLIATVPAASAMTFSGEVPAKGAVFTSPPTGIWLNAADAAPILKTGIVTLVDGQPRSTFLVNPWGPAGHWQYTLLWDEEAEEDYWDTVWVLDQDLTKAQVFLSGLTPSTDGTHTISVTLRTKAAPTTNLWQYKVRIAPKLGAPTPAANSIVNTTTPTITIPASDNSAVTTWTVSVNGEPASATLSGGLLRITPSAPLENDAISTVNVSVADALGLHTETTWSFKVQIYAEMADGPYASCQACHVGYSATHNKADDCWSCHGQYHGTTPSEIHTAADVTDCKPCHVSSITVEHSRRLLTCASCHTSTNPAVKNAIATGNSNCSACHTGSSGHEALHTTTVTPACEGTGCHVGTSLTGIHLATGSTLTCNSCHKSVDPLVTAAIAASDKACTACHNGATAHGDLSVAHTATMTSTTMSILGNDYGSHACSECHASARTCIRIAPRVTPRRRTRSSRGTRVVRLAHAIRPEPQHSTLSSTRRTSSEPKPARQPGATPGRGALRRSTPRKAARHAMRSARRLPLPARRAGATRI
jgi:hypothetical protein